MIKNTLVVLNYRDYETTSNFIENIKEYDSINKIVVVDNNSNDNSYEKLSKLSNEKIHVIKSEKNGGYSYGNNVGIKYAINKFNPEYIIISNPDVSFKNKTIYNMMNIYNEYENIAIVAPRMIDNNGIESCWKLPNYKTDLMLASSVISKLIGNPYKYEENDLNKAINFVEVLSGSFFMIPSYIIQEIDYMDEDIFLYCEEIILSKKLLSRGYRNIMINYDTFIHQHSVSIDKSISSRVKQHEILFDSKLIYHRKYENNNDLQMLIMKTIFKLGLVEKRVLLFVKNIILKGRRHDY